MISLSATSYDPSGAIILDAFIANPYDAERRGSVTATLDGGVSVYDTGYSVADQTIKSSIKYPTRANLETIKYLIAYYSQVIVCCEIGAYLGIPSMTMNKDTLNLSIRLVSRLDS